MIIPGGALRSSFVSVAVVVISIKTAKSPPDNLLPIRVKRTSRLTLLSSVINNISRYRNHNKPRSAVDFISLSLSKWIR
jgi:hypothetical protein